MVPTLNLPLIENNSEWYFVLYNLCMCEIYDFRTDYIHGFLISIPGPVTLLQVSPSTTIYGLVITWGPPSGSNYPTPVTYRVRYRERPSSGPPGSWSSTVVRSATQREYTTPTLKPGTRYEVEVWAVTNIGEGTRETHVATTYQGEYIIHRQPMSYNHCYRNNNIIIVNVNITVFRK